MKVYFSSESDEWGTPLDFFDKLNKEFNFILDPCTTSDNPLDTQTFYTKEDDGLTKQWYNPTFVNPPYGHGLTALKWVQKALEETERGVTTVMLLPARTDTKWFHDHIYGKHEIRFIRGRLKFRQTNNNGNSKNSAPFPTMIVIFKEREIAKQRLKPYMQQSRLVV